MNLREYRKVSNRLQLVVDTNQEVCINLLLTMKCNFACGHCMYASGPGRSATYMSQEDLEEIGEFARAIEQTGLRVNINLVGGEPTLDLEEFKRCFRTVMHWNLENPTYEMTTNGWWLRTYATTRDFAKVVAQELIQENLVIRISSSSYHDKFRRDEKGAMRDLKGYLQDEMAILAMREPQQCPECNKTEVFDVDTTCPHCQHIYTDDDQNMHYYAQECRGESCQINTLIEACEESRIYVEQQTDRVTPIGRAAKNGLGGAGGLCHAYTNIKFTFQPGGNLHDVCCNGGANNLGHARDGLALLFRRIAYMVDLHEEYNDREDSPLRADWYEVDRMREERCRACPGFASKWQEKNKSKITQADEFSHQWKIDRQEQLAEAA